MSSQLSDSSTQFDRVLAHVQDQIGTFFKESNALTCHVYLGRAHYRSEKMHTRGENTADVKYCDEHAVMLGKPLKQALFARGYRAGLKKSVNPAKEVLYITLTVLASQQPSEKEDEDEVVVVHGD